MSDSVKSHGFTSQMRLSKYDVLCTSCQHSAVDGRRAMLLGGEFGKQPVAKASYKASAAQSQVTSKVPVPDVNGASPHCLQTDSRHPVWPLLLSFGPPVELRPDCSASA